MDRLLKRPAEAEKCVGYLYISYDRGIDRISDRTEGKALGGTLPQGAAAWFEYRHEICFNKDCSIIPPSLASADSFSHILHVDTCQQPEEEKQVHFSYRVGK